MTSTTDLRTALATGQPVKLQDLVGARKVAAREDRAERARQAAERAEVALLNAELEAEAARDRAENEGDVEALRAMGLHGVYGHRNDGGLYRIGSLSDIDETADGSGEIVEVEHEYGYREWLPRAEVVLV
jgi:hypothetical protein